MSKNIRNEISVYSYDVGYFTSNITRMGSFVGDNKQYISLDGSMVSEMVAASNEHSQLVTIEGEKSAQKLLDVIQQNDKYSIYLLDGLVQHILGLKIEWLLLRIILEGTPATFCIYADKNFSSHNLNSFLRENTQDYTISYTELIEGHISVIVNIMPTQL